jgi:hypothetical protein
MRITTLKQLVTLALERRSVLLTHFNVRRLPAAVVINWPGMMIQRHIELGMYRYAPKTKKQIWTTKRKH